MIVRSIRSPTSLDAFRDPPTAYMSTPVLVWVRSRYAAAYIPAAMITGTGTGPTRPVPRTSYLLGKPWTSMAPVIT